MEMGQLAKKLWRKAKWLDGRLLAMIDNYHLTRKNARYDIGSKPAMFSK